MLAQSMDSQKRLGRYPADLGAITQLYAGLSEEAGDYGGKVCTEMNISVLF